MLTKQYYNHGEFREVAFRKMLFFYFLTVHQYLFGSPAGLWWDTAKKTVRDYIHGDRCGRRLRGWN